MLKRQRTASVLNPSDGPNDVKPAQDGAAEPDGAAADHFERKYDNPEDEPLTKQAAANGDGAQQEHERQGDDQAQMGAGQHQVDDPPQGEEPPEEPEDPDSDEEDENRRRASRRNSMEVPIHTDLPLAQANEDDADEEEEEKPKKWYQRLSEKVKSALSKSQERIYQEKEEFERKAKALAHEELEKVKRSATQAKQALADGLKRVIAL